MPHVAARVGRKIRTGRYQNHRPTSPSLSDRWQIRCAYVEQGKELPDYVQQNLEKFLQCGRRWSMAFWVRCESYHAGNTWSLSAVSVAVSAQTVGRGGWPKVPPCWLMKGYLNNPCVSGVDFPFSCVSCLPAGPRSWGGVLGIDLPRRLPRTVSGPYPPN